MITNDHNSKTNDHNSKTLSTSTFTRLKTEGKKQSKK